MVMLWGLQMIITLFQHDKHYHSKVLRIAFTLMITLYSVSIDRSTL